MEMPDQMLEVVPVKLMLKMQVLEFLKWIWEPCISCWQTFCKFGNVDGENHVVPVGYNYAKLSRDYISLGGKPFAGTEDAVEVEN